MDSNWGVASFTRRRTFSMIAGVLPALIAFPRIARAQDKPDFPDGYDAVQAAPNSHKVIFENTLVRVLEVIIPSPGTTEPMHHHRWPSFFLNWDTGGKTPHVHYLRPDDVGHLWSKRTIDSFGSIHPEGQETESMPTILCVSENLYLLHATVADIKQTGAQVLVAPSVDRAILLAGSHEPNLIVVIETNPYTNFGTPAALNAVCPRVPLLLLTSKRFESDQIPAGVDFISDYRSPLLRDEIKQLLTLVKVLKD